MNLENVHIVAQNNVNERIDKLLVMLHPDATRSQIQKWVKNKYVTINDVSVKTNYKCQLDDIIKWQAPEEKRIKLHPEPIPLDVIYEDTDLLVINKPTGMVVHPSKTHTNGTLVHALLYHNKHLSTVGGEERPGIVHRIDKDTSGLLIVAKNDAAHEALAQQLQDQTMERIYEAIVEGVLDHDQGLIDAPIGRNPQQRIQMAVVDNGKEAVTHFRVIKKYATRTHVACKLTTGRTHQIRVHLNYISHPIVGDPVYNKQHSQQNETQALFSKKISFEHPRNKRWVSFEIDPPDGFKQLLSNIENMS